MPIANIYNAEKSAEFNKIWSNSPDQILYRKCNGCVSSHQHIYYRRFDGNGLPTGFDMLDLILQNWFSSPKIQHNDFNVDFKLYSTYEDALLDQNEWKFCNFNDPTVGFPRDCAPNDKTDYQWYPHQNDVVFYIQVPNTYQT